MNQSKHYTASDIERYHSGQLSAAEMHAMEKAALDDPFLADALEGYTFTKTPANDLSVLQHKLRLRIEKEPKRRGLFYIGNQWMRVAALFVLIAGGGWLLFQTSSDNNKLEHPDIASNKPLQKETQAVTPESTVADSTTTVFQAPTASNAENDRADAYKTEEATGVSANDPVIVQNRPAYQALERKSKPGRITADSAVPGNTVAGIATYSAATLPDSLAGRSDVAMRKQNQSAGYLRPYPDTIRNVDVVLQRSEASMAEVVVINKNKLAERKDARSRMKPTVDTLEPAEGWTYFDDYIANNLKQPEELKTKPMQGEVELAFDVNKNGEPVNITVVKSLCQKCDEEAIRLLREGPKWKKGKKKGKVTIRF